MSEDIAVDMLMGGTMTTLGKKWYPPKVDLIVATLVPELQASDPAVSRPRFGAEGVATCRSGVLAVAPDGLLATVNFREDVFSAAR